MPPKKFTQRQIKVTSGGLFFNALEVEKKMDRLNQHNTSFFRPFNSVFDRDLHIMGK